MTESTNDHSKCPAECARSGKNWTPPGGKRTIPDEAVQAAANAIEARMFGQIKLGELALAALEAAAPYMTTVCATGNQNDPVDTNSLSK